MNIRQKVGAAAAAIALTLGLGVVAAAPAHAAGWQVCNASTAQGSIGSVTVIPYIGGVYNIAPGRCLWGISKVRVYAGQTVWIAGQPRYPSRTTDYLVYTNTWTTRTR